MRVIGRILALAFLVQVTTGSAPRACHADVQAATTPASALRDASPSHHHEQSPSGESCDHKDATTPCAAMTTCATAATAVVAAPDLLNANASTDLAIDGRLLSRADWAIAPDLPPPRA